MSKEALLAGLGNLKEVIGEEVAYLAELMNAAPEGSFAQQAVTACWNYMTGTHSALEKLIHAHSEIPGAAETPAPSP